MKKVFDRNMAGIDLKCYEKLNDSTEPNTTEDECGSKNDGNDREVARIMAVSPLADAQPRPPQPATPVKPPEPDYPPPVGNERDANEDREQGDRWGSVFRPIPVDDVTSETGSERVYKRQRTKRGRQPSQERWQAALDSLRMTPSFDRAAEQTKTHSGIINDGEQAYPYVRRHAHHFGGIDGVAFFSWLGLRETGDHRVFPDGEEEFALAPPILLQLDQADWRLHSIFNVPSFVPIVPYVTSIEDVNSVMHDSTDQRFSIAPMFAPSMGGVHRMRRSDWLTIQRGMLLAMEDYAMATKINPQKTEALFRHGLHYFNNKSVLEATILSVCHVWFSTCREIVTTPCC